jgi:hypothetical protein
MLYSPLARQLYVCTLLSVVPGPILRDCIAGDGWRKIAVTLKTPSLRSWFSDYSGHLALCLQPNTMHSVSAALAMFRVKGATRGQVFLRGLCLWLAGPLLFLPFNAANHHWPKAFADGTLFTIAVFAVTAELLALRNFQCTFGGFSWISATCVPLGLTAALYGLFMGGAILSVLYDHMTSRYDTVSMVVAVLLGIAVLRGIFGVHWQKRKYSRLETAALYGLVPLSVLLYALILAFVFREIFPK